MTEEGAPTPVEFTGTTREYFGIWAVNLLLSVATLGIYSAWAKVRNRKYFLRHTTIAGRRFDYHATGGQILVGRIIVLAALALGSVASTVFALDALLTIAFLFLLPWLINRGLAFNAAYTSWSNIRFAFRGSYWKAMRVFILYRAASIATLLLAEPYAFRARQRYVIGHHRLGDHSFSFDSGVRPFYAALLAVVAWFLLVAAVTFLILYLGLPEGRDLFLYREQEGEPPPAIFLIPVVGLLLALLPAATIYDAFVRNAVHAGAVLAGGHRFRSSIHPPRLLAIAITNTFAILLSFGLLLPWARIRVARYLAAHTHVRFAGSPDEFIGREEERQSALGDAYADLEGFDVGPAI